MTDQDLPGSGQDKPGNFLSAGVVPDLILMTPGFKAGTNIYVFWRLQP